MFGVLFCCSGRDDSCAGDKLIQVIWNFGTLINLNRVSL
jgi:hypothetical protein